MPLVVLRCAEGAFFHRIRVFSGDVDGGFLAIMHLSRSAEDVWFVVCGLWSIRVPYYTLCSAGLWICVAASCQHIGHAPVASISVLVTLAGRLQVEPER